MQISTSLLFKAVHRYNLIYNTCWEDPRLDREALQLKGDSSVAMITSAGCNALDYVLAGAGRIDAVDLNPKQNALLELKLAAARELSYDEFFEWFGKGRFHSAEKTYSLRLRKNLSESGRNVWDSQIKYFEGKGWRPSFYFRGTSGFFARLVNFYLDNIADARGSIEALLSAPDLATQQAVYFKELKPVFWTRFIRWFVNRDASLALVGVPAAQRQQVEKYCEGGMAGFVEGCLDAVFGKIPFWENYFWRVYLTGEYSSTCCPEYLKKDGFEKIRDGLWERIHVHTMSMTEYLNSSREPVSHFVLLDHMDWLNAKHRPLLEEEWQAIFNRARPSARVIWRSGGKKVDFVDTIKIQRNGKEILVGDALSYDYKKAEALHELDRVHTYGSFYIADLCAA